MTRVLVIAAHPDDEVLGMGGTITRHTDAGDAVRVLVVTDGSSTQYPGDAETRARKEEEAQKAAAELGVADYVHLDLPDMRLDTLAHVDVNRVVEEHVRDHAPAIVY
ncbi:MAG TPA: PIG-L family deacetylase, partial [Gaiellaceae bacterium]|nr:PIG-L family deacetylase [Gaiellaceae bacterium]